MLGYEAARLTGKGIYISGEAMAAVAHAGQRLTMAIQPDKRTKDYNESLASRAGGTTPRNLHAQTRRPRRRTLT